MTPNRVSQARFLLGWSQADLARASGVPANMITLFEAGGAIQPGRLAAIHKALIANGVRFMESGCVLRPSNRADALTGEQCRAARRALQWSQRRLAAEAGVPAAAVTVFEKTALIPPGHGETRSTRIALLCAALDRAGVEFTDARGSSVRVGEGLT